MPFLYLCGSAYLGAQEISFRHRRPNMKKILLLTITLLVTPGSTFSQASPVQTNNPGKDGPMQKMPLTLTIYQADQGEAKTRPDGFRNECNLLCDVWYPHNWTGPMFTVSLFFSICDSVSGHFCDHFFYIFFPLVDNSLRSRMSFLCVRWKMTELLQIWHALL